MGNAHEETREDRSRRQKLSGNQTMPRTYHNKCSSNRRHDVLEQAKDTRSHDVQIESRIAWHTCIRWPIDTRIARCITIWIEDAISEQNTYISLQTRQHTACIAMQLQHQSRASTILALKHSSRNDEAKEKTSSNDPRQDADWCMRWKHIPKQAGPWQKWWQAAEPARHRRNIKKYQHSKTCTHSRNYSSTYSSSCHNLKNTQPSHHDANAAQAVGKQVEANEVQRKENACKSSSSNRKNAQSYRSNYSARHKSDVLEQAKRHVIALTSR